MEAVFRNGRAYTLKMGLLQNFLIGLVICLCCFHLTTSCSLFELQFGNVTDDQEIGVGSPLRFQCSLFPEIVEDYGVTSKNLTLKVGKTVLSHTRVVDNYTLEYVVERCSVADTGFYQCFVPIPDFDQPQLVCASSISVGTKPQEVSNFTCIGSSFRNLSCSWIPPPNNIATTYWLSDYLNNNPSMTRRCPLPNLKASSCQFGVDTKPPYLRNQATLNFILQGKNSLGTMNQYISIKHFEIVKPGTPSKVSLKDVSEDSMVIEILAPKGLEYGEFPNGLIYEILYYSISTKLDVVKVATVQNKTNAELEIKDLVPHTQYKFEVRCRLNITGDRYYMSDEVNVNEITRSDVPYMAPEVDASAFDLQLVDNNAIITLYWKAVPSEFENGEKFHYFVKYHEHYVASRFKRRAKRDLGTLVKLENSTTHTFKDLDKDTAYIFTIIAANDVGHSFNQTAVMVVDKAKKLLQGPKDITVVLYNQGHYDISWKSPDPELNTFTVATCETLKSRPAKCEGPISFTTVKNRTHHKFSHLNSKTNYQFAVAATAEERTSGLHWANCIVAYGVVYGVKSVQMMPKTSTSLKLSWSYLCPAVSQVIREIEIAMCPSQETCSARNFERCSVNDLGIGGWPTLRITNSSLTEFVMGDLRPFTQYYAVLRVRTDAGWGTYSHFGCESTMQSAPSDPPSDVYAEIQPIQDSMRASIRVSFEPPNTPNGVISRYVVYYNNTSSSGDGKDKEVRVQDSKGTATVLEKISYHTNYSIEVAACVGQACSPLSEPIFLYTGISNPGIVNLPRVELRESDVNVSWDSPVLPNGPLDYFQVLMASNESKVERVYNVSGQNFLSIERSCETKDADHSTYEFKVRAINMKDGMPFYGDYSSPLQTLICSEGGSLLLYFGLAIAIAAGFLIFAISTFCCVRWAKYNIIAAKRTKVQLPQGLESSLDNPLNTYDKFKSGLQNNHDSGIPYERGYERFFSPTSQNDVKNTEGLSKRGTTGRNLSGESNFSGKCHDSVSSANTTKTHNSIDSGTEIESPPSPDSFCSDSGSANTTPRAFKPGLDIVNEINPLTSRDSGLEKEGSSRVAPNPNFTGKNMWYVRRPNDAQLNAYSMFAFRGASNTPPYVQRREQNLVDCLSLSNSEPSVADFDVGDGTEPLVNPVMQPYSKFGLARSASNGINLSQPLAGYCKFGIVYRPLKNSPQFGPHDQQVFPAAMSVAFPYICSPSFKKKEDAMLGGRTIAPEYGSDAYSKFGVVEVDSIDDCACSPPDDASGFVNLDHDGLFSFPDKVRFVECGQKPEPARQDNPYCSLPSDGSKGWSSEGDKMYLSLPTASDTAAPSEDVAYPDLCFPPSEPTDFLQNPMRGSSPSHKAHPNGQSSEEEDELGPTRVQFTDDFINKALTGGYGFEAPSVCEENTAPVAVADFELPTPNPKLENYAFRKACSNVDELLRCLDNGCLPELVLPASRPDDTAENDTFFTGGNVSGIDQTELNCPEQKSRGQTAENGIEQLDDMPAGKDFSEDLQENEPQPNHPVPNVYVKVPNVKDSENIAQVVFQSNSSFELV